MSACTRRSLDALDQRGARIKAELDEARRLREEAQSCSPNTSASSSEAEREAEAIIAGAKAEAERIAAEAKAKMEDFVARRTKMAETKIAQAEAQALADVRAAAADAAVAAAEKILTRDRQGQGRRRPDRPGHRGREDEAELAHDAPLSRRPAHFRCSRCAAPRPQRKFLCTIGAQRFRSWSPPSIADRRVHNLAMRIALGTRQRPPSSGRIGDARDHLRLQWRTGRQRTDRRRRGGAGIRRAPASRCRRSRRRAISPAAGRPTCSPTVEAATARKLPPNFAATLAAATLRRLRAELRATPHVEHALTWLRGPKCVASSSPLDRVRVSLETTGLLRFFEPYLFSASDVPRGKPAPDLFLHAAAQDARRAGGLHRGGGFAGRRRRGPRRRHDADRLCRRQPHRPISARN